MAIVTGNIYFQHSFKVRYQSSLLRLMQKHGIGPRGLVEEPPAEAIVRQGRWIVLCPSPECKGAEFAWDEGFFYCASCLNAHVDHKMMLSKFPKGRREIEEILEPRRIPNRNWEPPETSEQLRVENSEHGLPSPERAR